GRTVIGVNTGAHDRSTSPDDELGGGGRFSIGFASNVVGAIVMSSLMSAALTTGVAGRAIASGGRGDRMSSGMSIASSASFEIDTSADDSSGKIANSARWNTAAPAMEYQNQSPNPRLKRSFAVLYVDSMVSTSVHGSCAVRDSCRTLHEPRQR